jgi:hypothetical protein
MNERIRDLAEQATTYIEPTANSGEGWIFDKEKFAELIVGECVDIAYDYDAPKMSGPGMIIAGRIETTFRS